MSWSFRTKNWNDPSFDRKKMLELRMKGLTASNASAKHDPEANPTHGLYSKFIESQEKHFIQRAPPTDGNW